MAAESEHGIAVCDSDPLKLHYAWSLRRIGHTNRDAFERQAAAYRNAIAQNRLGFADLFLVTNPDVPTLTARMSNDVTRRRRHFALHVRLGDPLREWYQMIAELLPASVHWALPPGGLAGFRPTARPREPLATFDALVAQATRLASSATTRPG